MYIFKSIFRQCIYVQSINQNILNFRYFPPSLKDHASHDVLLLCMSCHVRSTQYDTVLRYQLADECNAPIDMGSGTKQLSDHDLQKVRSAAR